jgi:hypothetical protein
MGFNCLILFQQKPKPVQPDDDLFQASFNEHMERSQQGSDIHEEEFYWHAMATWDMVCGRKCALAACLLVLAGMGDYIRNTHRYPR